jgi:GntR family transcriptional regulator
MTTSSLRNSGGQRANQVLTAIADRIKHGVYPPGSRLPPEKGLATEFHVSRATIRQAMSKLADRGLVIRKQGDGTYVAQLTGIANPLNQYIDIRQRIADHGYVPGLKTISAGTIEASIHVAKPLGVQLQSRVLKVEKVFTADDDPIIFVIGYIPIWVYHDHVADDEIESPAFTTEPWFEFFADRCHQPVKYYISTIRAELPEDLSLPDAHLSAHRKPILTSENVGYGHDERPLFLGLEHIVGGTIDLQIVRRVDIY